VNDLWDYVRFVSFILFPSFPFLRLFGLFLTTDIDSAIDVYGTDEKMITYVIENTKSGGVSINAAAIQAALPGVRLSHPLFVFSFLHLLTSVQNRNDSFPSEESGTQEREFITVSMGSESSPIPREFSEEERLEKISSQLFILLMLPLRRLLIMPSRKLDYNYWCWIDFG
jgi:hypothetical protein